MPCGTLILSCSDDKTLRLWDRVTGKEIRQVGFSSTPSSIEISPDGTIITLTQGKNITFLNSAK